MCFKWNVYQSAIIQRNLPCSEKFLVVPLMFIAGHLVLLGNAEKRTRFNAQDLFIVFSLFLPLIKPVTNSDLCTAKLANVWIKNPGINVLRSKNLASNRAFSAVFAVLELNCSPVMLFRVGSILTNFAQDLVMLRIWLWQMDTKPTFLFKSGWWRLKFPPQAHILWSGVKAQLHLPPIWPHTLMIVVMSC